MPCLFQNLLFAAVALCSITAVAQESVKEQPVPFSVWLDFNELAGGSKPPALPIWMESFEEVPVEGTNSAPPKTVFRVRIRQMPSLHSEVLVRVFFDDVPDLHPVISTWSETGIEAFRSPALGTGTGLPTSESVVVPLKGADYIDLDFPGDGTSSRGAFISSLKTTQIQQAQDFVTNQFLDPFGKSAPLLLDVEDSKLLGRIKAPLDSSDMRLTPKNPSGLWEFELMAQTGFAMLTFEVLNADIAAPPIVGVNDAPVQFASVAWPDIADPGFRTGRDGRTQYTGWLRGQCMIPGASLKSGLNKVIISMSQGSGSVAVRNLELQLKQ